MKLNNKLTPYICRLLGFCTVVALVIGLHMTETFPPNAYSQGGNVECASGACGGGGGGCGGGGFLDEDVWGDEDDVFTEDDSDGDDILNSQDNCPNVPNNDQADSDGDGVGDVCDNCVNASNDDQANNDGDSSGDACDNDDDNDTVNDGSDNCVFIPNVTQSNLDNDSKGDACDGDMDGDSILNNDDECPGFPGDGSGLTPTQFAAMCFPDTDNDGVGEGDNCPDTANAGQEDNDGDGKGDVCDLDTDGDGVANSTDNCPDNNNPDQEEADGDGKGDACDALACYVADQTGEDLENCLVVDDPDKVTVLSMFLNTGEATDIIALRAPFDYTNAKAFTLNFLVDNAASSAKGTVTSRVDIVFDSGRGVMSTPAKITATSKGELVLLMQAVDSNGQTLAARTIKMQVTGDAVADSGGGCVLNLRHDDPSSKLVIGTIMMLAFTLLIGMRRRMAGIAVKGRE